MEWNEEKDIVVNAENTINKELSAVAARLLESGEVEVVIGYGASTLEGKATPIFITQAGDAGKLIFDRTCNVMLAKYLLGYRGKKVGIVAKPCDTRAIVSYMVENQLEREKLKIIGVSCNGMDGNAACNECITRNPVICDYKIGDDIDVSKLKPCESPADELERLSAGERWQYISKEFEKCIKCYACRQACYLCYCSKCFVDRNQPEWTQKGTGLGDIMSYHMIRAMHTAGRCINCGACESTCPMGINARLLVSKLYKDSKDLYGYEPGMDPEEKTALTDFKPDDYEGDFMK